MAGSDLARGQHHLLYCLTIVFSFGQDLGLRKQWWCEMRFLNNPLRFQLLSLNLTGGRGVCAGHEPRGWIQGHSQPPCTFKREDRLFSEGTKICACLLWGKSLWKQFCFVFSFRIKSSWCSEVIFEKTFLYINISLSRWRCTNLFEKCKD